MEGGEHTGERCQAECSGRPHLQSRDGPEVHQRLKEVYKSEWSGHNRTQETVGEMTVPCRAPLGLCSPLMGNCHCLSQLCIASKTQVPAGLENGLSHSCFLKQSSGYHPIGVSKDFFLFLFFETVSLYSTDCC